MGIGQKIQAEISNNVLKVIIQMLWLFNYFNPPVLDLNRF